MHFIDLFRSAVSRRKAAGAVTLPHGI